MAQLLQRISSSGSQWVRTSRMNMPVSANDNHPPTLFSAIKEAASTLRETQIQISSVLSVQADVQERINYWQTELGNALADNPVDVSTDNDLKQPSRAGNVPPSHLCENPEEVGESWIS